jgi:predicted nucleic acid-binding protein
MLDTGPLFSLYDSSDIRAHEVRSSLRTCEERKFPLYVTHIVAAESHSLVLQRLGHGAALALLNTIYAGGINIAHLVGEDIQKALSIIDRYKDQDISFADATTMAVMSRLGIRHVLSYDHHFLVLNFIIAPPLRIV